MRWLMLIMLFVGIAAKAQHAGVEQLYVMPPSGWTIGFHDVKGNVELTEMLPPGQTLSNWTEMLTVEMIQGKPTMDAQTTLNARLDAIRQGCEDVGAGPAQISVENGYDVGMRAIGCPKSKRYGKGEMSLYKVILGRTRSYIVSRAWSGEPFDKDKMPLPAKTTDDWLAFMSKVVLCDSGDRSHPCPATK
jgi:hypothetical protein